METPFDVDPSFQQINNEMFSFKLFVLSKEKKTMVIELLTKNKQVEVTNVYFSKNPSDKDKSIYTGPDFYSLNPALQQAILSYLNELGLSSDTLKIVKYLGLNKENRELIKWLMKLSSFVKV